MTFGTILFLAGLTLSQTWGWAHAGTLSMIIVGIGLLGAFVVSQYFIKDSLVPIRFIMTRNLLLINLFAFCIGCVVLGSNQLLPYVIRSPVTNILPADKKTMLNIGLVMLPNGLIQVITSPFTFFFGKKLGFSNLASVLTAIMTISLGFLIKWHLRLAETIILNTIFGFTIAGCMSSITVLLSQNTEPRLFGAVAGASTLIRISGMAVGPVVVHLMMNRKMISVPIGSGSDSSDVLVTPDNSGYTNSFALMTAFAGLGLLGTFFITPKRPKTEKPSKSPPPTTTDSH
jgi:MFS family permease